MLFDLYAGTGTIGILLAPHFSRVYSVEYSESASRDGTINAQKNSLKHIDFIHAKVEDFAREAFARGERADTLVVDPPRDGLHPSAIPNLLGFSAKEIIYVSCNPATLVRDLRLMLAGDLPPEITSRYRITDIIPVDMFPHTHHIETVVRLEKI